MYKQARALFGKTTGALAALALKVHDAIMFAGMPVKGPVSPAGVPHNYALGVDSVDVVQPGATVDVVTKPQVTFRPLRLVIPDDVAGDFTIENISIGRESQFVNAVALPGIVFSNLTNDPKLSMKTAQIAQDITVRVTNNRAAAIRFTGAFIGVCVQF